MRAAALFVGARGYSRFAFASAAMIRCAATVVGVVFLWASGALAQDVSPLRDRHVWLPMTGMTDPQMAEARRVGDRYEAVVTVPPLSCVILSAPAAASGPAVGAE
jgi:hypothetical protein